MVMPGRFISVLIVCVLGCERTPRDGSRGSEGSSAAADAADSATASSTPALAVTIDDLPWIGVVRPGETKADALRRLIDSLVSRDAPAVGYANCDRAGSGAPLLRMWQEAGLELGNHTAAHLDLNDAPLDDWLDGARRCHEMIAGLTNAGRVSFRYPFLHQGPTAERQNAALALLLELDSPVAHVTIDNSDWILAVAYGDAVTSGDTARASAIGDAFIDHILRAVDHYRDVARTKAGRDVPHVLLLHANLLVADHLGRLLDRLQADHGFEFVSVEAAQRDPIYDRPDDYTGPGGLSWLYRMHPATPELQSWDDAEAQRLRRQWR
jgi:peptidoglycan-N-acetylglucosamine deacetylase